MVQYFKSTDTDTNTYFEKNLKYIFEYLVNKYFIKNANTLKSIIFLHTNLFNHINISEFILKCSY